jgi:hypothetical protein
LETSPCGISIPALHTYSRKRAVRSTSNHPALVLRKGAGMLHSAHRTVRGIAMKREPLVETTPAVNMTAHCCNWLAWASQTYMAHEAACWLFVLSVFLTATCTQSTIERLHTSHKTCLLLECTRYDGKRFVWSARPLMIALSSFNQTRPLLLRSTSSAQATPNPQLLTLCRVKFL